MIVNLLFSLSWHLLDSILRWDFILYTCCRCFLIHHVTAKHWCRIHWTCSLFQFHRWRNDAEKTEGNVGAVVMSDICRANRVNRIVYREKRWIWQVEHGEHGEHDHPRDHDHDPLIDSVSIRIFCAQVYHPDWSSHPVYRFFFSACTTHVLDWYGLDHP